MYDSTIFYFVYIPGDRTTENWKLLPEIMDEAIKFTNKNYGQYPYPVYSIIQGGDGGMEYPMATLITGERNIGSLVGVSVHEWMHNTYQNVLANNESLYAWMDEGFGSWATSETMNHLRKNGLIPGEYVVDPHLSTIKGYIRFSKSGYDQPISTHADHYKTNSAYGVGAYTKGAVCLTQLEYILGTDVFRKALLKYYNTWKFKHPNANDFFRIMEKESGLELDWFKEYFVYSTDIPDYAVGEVSEADDKINIELIKLAQMPMPLDVTVEYADGTSELFYIAPRVMRGQKLFDDDLRVTYLEDWPWTHPTYGFSVKSPVISIHIDKSGKMYDSNRENNIWYQESK